MIPIGAPVTIKLGPSKIDGIVVDNDRPGPMKYRVRTNEGSFCLFSWEVKIACHDPVPFTLWQYNALMREPANTPWKIDDETLGPDYYLDYWGFHDMCMSYDLKPILPITVPPRI